MFSITRTISTNTSFPPAALVLGALAVVALGACGDATDNEPDGLRDAPQVLGVSTASISVGEPMLLLAENLLVDEDADEAAVLLRFDGVFEGRDGTTTDAQFEVTTTYHGALESGEQMLRWSRFGPFDNPFSATQQPGTFRGSVTPIIKRDGAPTREGNPSDEITIEVEPSLIIESLQPLVAECGAPAIRGLGGVPYEMTVRAMGFTPVSFRYELESVNGEDGMTVIEHTATAPTDSIGWNEPFVLNPVPDGDTFYVTILRVLATDARGNTVETALPYTVHRPIEVRYHGGLEVAQYYAPTPVTGCIPGQVGNRVTYSETQSETRQQSVTITVSQNWSRANGVTSTSSWTDGYAQGVVNTSSTAETLSESEAENRGETYGVSHNASESNSIGFSSTDGESWSYNVTENTTNTEGQNRTTALGTSAEVSGSVQVEGEAGIPGIANGSVSTTVGARAGVSADHSWGNTSSSSRSAGTGFSTSGTTSQDQSFGSVTSEGTTESLGGSYALSSSATRGRSFSDTESRSDTRTYSFGESAGSSEVVSEGLTDAESRTWVESSTSSTLTSYSGVIPTGRFGVFYRQTTRLVRRAGVYTFDLCGVEEKQSEMTFNEWTWAPELAIGADCGAELPPSQLPAAECFIEPCVY